jgi:hypothetical protein
MGSSPAPPAAVTQEQARAIAKEAYIYGFPMVDNYRVQYAYFVNKENPEYKGGPNEIHNTARVYTPEDTAIQTPNSDTPYSALGADLRAEPLVLTVPPIEQDRYYSLQFVDGYTHNFAYVGGRTTGNGGGKYLLAGPNWKGDKPVRHQRGHPVRHRPGGRSLPHPIVRPVRSRLSFALRFAPTLPAEEDLRARFATIGVGPDGDFEADKLTPEMRTAIEGGMADALAEFNTLRKDKVDTGQVGAAQFFGTAADTNGNYLYRMAGAVLGIYGNTAAEAMYPSFANDSAGAPVDRRQPLHVPVRAGPSPAGQRFLVADDVRAAAELAGGQPAAALPDQLADADQPRPRSRWRLHVRHPEHLAGHRKTVELAARAERRA